MDATIAVSRSIDSTPVSMPAVSETYTDISKSFTDDVAILTTDTNKEVDLIAVTNAQMRSLIITSDIYGAALTVRFGVITNTAYPLTGMMVMTRPCFAILTAAGVTEIPTKLFVTNGLASNVNIRVEAVYDPTP